MKRVLILFLLVVFVVLPAVGLFLQTYSFYRRCVLVIMAFILFLSVTKIWSVFRPPISDTESADRIFSPEVLNDQPDGLFSDDEEED